MGGEYLHHPWMLVDVEVPLKDDVNISLLDQWFR